MKDYPYRPVVLGDIAKLLSQNALTFTSTGIAQINSLHVPPRRQYPLIDETVSGLLLDLAPGTPLAKKFHSRLYVPYEKAKSRSTTRLGNFGHLIYYPSLKELVAFAPPQWHRLALLTRNSLLIRDPSQTITQQQQWNKLRRVVVAVAGASVGKNAFLSLIDTLNPDRIKIADPKSFKTTNARRTSINFRDIGQNKAIVAARQAHEINPFIDIDVYPQGVNDSNISGFLSDADFVVEETDNPIAKINLRQHARQQKKIVIMITDIGIAYQIDIRNFRDYPKSTLAVGVSDRELLAAQQQAQTTKSRDKFLDFAWKMIGYHWQTIPEFADLITEKLPSQFTGGIPQLGVASYAGGADVALTVALMALGYKRHERVVVDPRTREIITQGKLV